MYFLDGTQEYTVEQFETLGNILQNARQTVINTYENQLIHAFEHKNTICVFINESTNNIGIQCIDTHSFPIQDLCGITKNQ